MVKHKGLLDEGNAHIYLGQLLRKKRSAQQKALVLDIMESYINIAEKIKKIELVDKKEYHEIGEKATFEWEEDTKSLTKKKQIERKLKRLKNNFSRCSFLGFLKNISKIRNFARRSHVIICRLFPPRIKINSDTRLAFKNYLQKDVMALLQYIYAALKSGWLHLSKFEYNLIAQFKDLCEAIIALNFNLLYSKDKDLLNKYKTIERFFLICHFRPRYPEIIISTISLILKKLPKFKIKEEDAVNLSKKVLYQWQTLPSFYNFILGLNIVKYRQMFQINELINDKVKAIINKDSFNCSAKIKEKINSYIKRCIKNIEFYQKDYVEILKIKKYINLTDINEYDIGLLQYFYEHEYKSENCNFNKDKETILLFSHNYFAIFISIFNQILNDKITLENDRTVQIFSSDYFQLEFDKLNYYNKKLDKISFSFPNFTRKRFLMLKNSKKRALSMEKQVLQLIDELIQIVINIGRKLNEVLSYHNIEQQKGKEFIPLEIVDVRKKNFSIPYWEDKIKSPVLFHGQNVLKSLSFIVSICFLSAIFFYDQKIHALLAREKKIKEELLKHKKILKRIAEKNLYSKIVNKYCI